MEGRRLSDLIDTQWNVNDIADVATEVAAFDLIDTQWNVNLELIDIPNCVAKI